MVHIIRPDSEDPLRQVTFKERNLKGARLEKMKAGKLKMDWTWEGKKKFGRNSDMESTSLSKGNRTNEGNIKEN